MNNFWFKQLLFIAICSLAVKTASADTEDYEPSIEKLKTRRSSRFLKNIISQSDDSLPKSKTKLSPKVEEFTLPESITSPSHAEKNTKDFHGLHITIPVRVIDNLFIVVRVVKVASPNSHYGFDLKETTKTALLVECNAPESKHKEGACSLVRNIPDLITENISPYKDLRASKTSVSYEGVSCTLISGFMITSSNFQISYLYCYDTHEGFKKSQFIRIDSAKVSYINDLMKNGETLSYLQVENSLVKSGFIHNENIYLMQYKLPTREQLGSSISEDDRRALKSPVQMVRLPKGLQVNKLLKSRYFTDSHNNQKLEVVLKVTGTDGKEAIETRTINLENGALRVSEKPSFSQKLNSDDISIISQEKQALMSLEYKGTAKKITITPECNVKTLESKLESSQKIKEIQDITPQQIYSFGVIRYLKGSNKNYKQVFQICEFDKEKHSLVYQAKYDKGSYKGDDKVLDIKETQDHGLEIWVVKTDDSGDIKKIVFQQETNMNKRETKVIVKD